VRREDAARALRVSAADVAAPGGRRWRRRWHGARRSIQWRLVGLFLLFAVATTVTFLGGMQQVLRGGWQGYVRPLVADYLDRLAADLGSPPDIARAVALVARLPLAIRIEGPQVQWDSHPERRERWRQWQQHRRGWWSDEAEHAGDWWQTRTLADGHRISFGLADAPAGLRPRAVGWTTLAVLLLLTLIAYGTVRHLLRPLDDIRAGVLRFGRGEFDQPIVQRRRDELGDLAGTINTMAAELRSMLDAKRALLLAISHELRSPLTRARVNAELIDESEPRSALLRDLAEMRDLVTDLLESERLAGGHAALQREPTSLDELVREVVGAQFAGRPLSLRLDAGDAPLELDRVRVRLLLRNLIDNALRHNVDAALPVTVSTAREGAVVSLVVRDFGPGVPDEQLARLSEPFHRVDSARQRSTGGVGLGLYLSRLVVQAHRGTLELRNAAPGLQVTVRFDGDAADTAATGQAARGAILGRTTKG
jgi:signal transduction histidine kinase